MECIRLAKRLESSAAANLSQLNVDANFWEQGQGSAKAFGLPGGRRGEAELGSLELIGAFSNGEMGHVQICYRLKVSSR